MAARYDTGEAGAFGQGGPSGRAGEAEREFALNYAGEVASSNLADRAANILVATRIIGLSQLVTDL